MSKEFNLELYVVTDRELLHGLAIEEQVEQAIMGGATMVQLREKSLSTREFIAVATNVNQVTEKYAAPLIINDRLDVVLATKAAGLHVGQSDMPVSIARRLLGTERILGVSVANVAEALQAQSDGADYLGVGAVFPTGTKLDAGLVTLAELAEITRVVNIPVAAIGGINEENALQLKGSGVRGIAVVSAIFGRGETKAASRRMRRLAREIMAGNSFEQGIRGGN